MIFLLFFAIIGLKGEEIKQMKFKAIIISFLLFSASVTAAEKFVTFSSGICEFNLLDYELSKSVENAIVFGASRIFDTYKDSFGFSYSNNFKMKVFIIRDQTEFLNYQRTHGLGINSEIGYFYFERYGDKIENGKVVVWGNESTEKMISTLFHEMSHFMLGYSVPWVPRWLNEGIAVYFGGLNVLGDNKRIYLSKNRDLWCKYWAKNGFPITLQGYVSLNSDEWKSFNAKDGNAAYTIGYSFVYFLMSRSETEVILKELLWDFKRHGKDANSIEVIDNNYRGGFKRLEKNWRNWIPRAKPYRPLRALRKAAEESKAKNIDLVDRGTRRAIKKIESEYAGWFNPENRYQAASQEEKKAIINQWKIEAEGDDLTKKARAIASLGNVKEKEAVGILISVVRKPMDNNLPKWMAERALGRIGDKRAIPSLIELVDHDDLNVKVYARAALAEITGVYFDDDKEKWRKWYAEQLLERRSLK